MQHCETAAGQVESFPLGRLAQTRLKLMLMLRERDQNPERDDRESHYDGIMRLKAKAPHSPRTASYLRWYQAIALADAGEAEDSRRRALDAFLKDAKIMDLPQCEDVGRRQYSSLRRFIEDYSRVLRNPSLLGQISQILQAGHHPSARAT